MFNKILDAKIKFEHFYNSLKPVAYHFYNIPPSLLLSWKIFAFATRKTCGTILTSVLNKSSEISRGSSNCNVLNSAPPHVALSIINPFAHLNTNSARRIHHGTVISSDISCRKSAGIVSIVTSCLLAVFRIFRSPSITGCREFISSGLLNGSSEIKWNMMWVCDRFEWRVIKKSPDFNLPDCLDGELSDLDSSFWIFSIWLLIWKWREREMGGIISSITELNGRYRLPHQSETLWTFGNFWWS